MAAGCSGGDWDAVEDRWNLPRYYSMVEHWKNSGPPVYMSVAAFLGLDKKESRVPDDEGTGDLEELASAMGALMQG